MFFQSVSFRRRIGLRSPLNFQRLPVHQHFDQGGCPTREVVGKGVVCAGQNSIGQVIKDQDLVWLGGTCWGDVDMLGFVKSIMKPEMFAIMLRMVTRS